MAWSLNFRNLSNDACAEFLYQFIKNVKPEDENENIKENDKKDEKKKNLAYKDVLKFIIGGILVDKEFKLISDGAKNDIKDNKNNIKPVPEKTYKGLRREHTIPISCLYDYIYKKRLEWFKDESKKDEIKNEESIKKELIKIINATRGLSLITKDEDEKLNGKGYRSKLPEGIKIEDVISGRKRFDIRYKTAQIDTVNFTSVHFN